MASRLTRSFSAFAVVHNAGKRALGIPFDVQPVGGASLPHWQNCRNAEQQARTLVTLPAYLNALWKRRAYHRQSGDYLADAMLNWMGRLHRFLGLTVGVNLSQMEHDVKQAAYAADITYGTNNEFGFDYLRDNIVI